MAVSQGLLMGMALFAAALSLSPYARIEREAVVGLLFTAAMVWGTVSVFGFSVHSQAWTGTETVWPAVYFGGAFAFATMALALYHLSKLLGREAGATDSPSLLNRL